MRVSSRLGVAYKLGLTAFALGAMMAACGTITVIEADGSADSATGSGGAPQRRRRGRTRRHRRRARRHRRGAQRQRRHRRGGRRQRRHRRRWVGRHHRRRAGWHRRRWQQQRHRRRVLFRYSEVLRGRARRRQGLRGRGHRILRPDDPRPTRLRLSDVREQDQRRRCGSRPVGAKRLLERCLPEHPVRRQHRLELRRPCGRHLGHLSGFVGPVIPRARGAQRREQPPHLRRGRREVAVVVDDRRRDRELPLQR